MKVFVTSLGCPKNWVDSELMVGLLLRRGAELTTWPDQADVIIVNTCAFLQSATEESIDTILEMAQYKRAGCCRTLIVTGCLVQRYREDLSRSLPEVDLFVGTGQFHRIVELLDSPRPQGVHLSEGSYLYQAGDPRVPLTRGGTAYLKVAEGCGRTCSFCLIPHLRGPQRSREIGDVVQEARSLQQRGIKEVVLIAQDLTAYGVDRGKGENLEVLLKALDRQTEIDWIRLMYCYPDRFPDSLIEVIRDSERILPYVDIPLQHISERILRSMRRNVGRDRQLRLIEKLRAIPGMVLRTTLMVGYPGETQAQFEELCEWIHEAEFDRMGVFAFSAEEGTLAAELPDQVPGGIKEDRREQLLAIQQEISLHRNRELIGSQLTVLVDGPSDEHEWVTEGRYYGQAPEVDGVVYLSFEHPDLLEPPRPGDFVRVVIGDARAYDLVGSVVPEGSQSVFPTGGVQG